MTICCNCDHCGSAGEVGLPDASMGRGLLACPHCGAAIKFVDVSGASSWIDREVTKRCSLATRKQDANRSDLDISRVGLTAEFAAAAILCPSLVDEYMRQVEQGGGNRGRDIPSSLTGLDKPVEIKQTTHRSATTGFLLVRPPRWTPGPMRVEYLDDAYYVLMIGDSFAFRMAGWTDRDGLAAGGKLNPVPCNGRQRECWGIHWQKLSAPELLLPQVPVF